MTRIAQTDSVRSFIAPPNHVATPATPSFTERSHAAIGAIEARADAIQDQVGIDAAPKTPEQGGLTLRQKVGLAIATIGIVSTLVAIGPGEAPRDPASGEKITGVVPDLANEPAVYVPDPRQ